MLTDKRIIFVSCVLLQLLALLLFLKGFFPVKVASSAHASLDDNNFDLIEQCRGDKKTLLGAVPENIGKSLIDYVHPNDDGLQEQCFVPRSIGRLVFILIDALRADFVLPSSSFQATADVRHGDMDKMKYLHDLIDKNLALGFLSKAHPPTVTLPRIKALTTGTVPGFIDVVLNLDTTSLTEDNIVSQLQRNGRRSVFYGDETWMRLFPGRFVRSEGTTSFFISDYTEVDNNVTRHLRDELDRSDWDVMFLHYLGLDHIGHLAGPKSTLVLPKLSEMDNIIKYIYETVQQQEYTNPGLPTLVVVCGDHGMSDQGSHGGATPSETLTPIVFLSSLYEHNSRGHLIPQSEGEVKQIDLAVTLSLLLDLPIPRNSLGILLLPALLGLPLEHRLKAGYINARQILGVVRENVENVERHPGYHELNVTIAMHIDWLLALHNLSSPSSLSSSSVALDAFGERILSRYAAAIREMRDELIASQSNYDLHAMIVGILIEFAICITLLSECFTRCTLTTSATNTFPGFSLFVVLGGAAVSMLYLAVCTEGSNDKSLCYPRSTLVPVMFVLAYTIILCMSNVHLAIRTWLTSKKIIRLSAESTEKKRVSPLYFLITGVVGHSLSLMSSSFVEEEHQTWYFLTTTILILLSVCLFIKSTSHPQTRNAKKSDDQGLLRKEKTLTTSYDPLNLKSRHSSSGPVTVDRSLLQRTVNVSRKTVKTGTFEPDGLTNEAVLLDHQRLLPLFACVVCVFLCRAARSLNQTGDKWSHLLDAGDWLVRPENMLTLSLVNVFSLLGISVTIVKQTKDTSVRVLFIVGAFFVYCHLSAEKMLIFPFVYRGAMSKGLLEAWVVYFVLLLVLCRSFFCFLKHFSTKTVAEELDPSAAAINHKNDTNETLQSEVYSEQCVAICQFWCNLRTALTLLMLLLARSHNVTLILIFNLQSACLKYVVTRTRDVFVSPIVLSLLYTWMGQAAFFYQGNSNSLSTINLAAGYTGLDEYNLFFVGFLTIVNTYAGPVYWLFCLMEVLAIVCTASNKLTASYAEAVSISCFTIISLRSIVIAPYMILSTLLRYHLFVWTVFSPKLLYEAMLTSVVSLLVLCFFIAARFVTSYSNIRR